MGSSDVLTYAAVTPARDEEGNLTRLADSLTAQAVKPAMWVIVENGSKDRTFSVATQLAAERPWVKVVQIEGSSSYQRTTAEHAFHVGVQALDGAGDLVAKLDADVSFETNYFEGVIAAFAADPELGIASGTLREQADGKWREQVLLGNHCWGPTRTYRRACLDAVLPLDGGPCFTWVDETKARLAGFTTSTLRQLPFHHHRPQGADEGSMWAHWCSQGAGSHRLGYRPSYLLARCAFRALRQPAALGLIPGYLGAVLRSAPRYSDERVIAALRDQQRARRFLSAVRRDDGRRRGAPTGRKT